MYPCAACYLCRFIASFAGPTPHGPRGRLGVRLFSSMDHGAASNPSAASISQALQSSRLAAISRAVACQENLTGGLHDLLARTGFIDICSTTRRAFLLNPEIEQAFRAEASLRRPPSYLGEQRWFDRDQVPPALDIDVEVDDLAACLRARGFMRVPVLAHFFVAASLRGARRRFAACPLHSFLSLLLGARALMIRASWVRALCTKNTIKLRPACVLPIAE